ncbi:aldehyde dehydrogenase family protein [Leucobacter albus]|uniref:Aldehyde dehydrogenase family protein n=1 Tax=Leucobacter albus TaxID=272210 RepID=A0ABW3TS67_9MICO
MTNSKFPLLIDGQWVNGDLSVENRNPSDVSDLIGHFDTASRAQTETAIAAANHAARGWARTSPFERAEILQRAGELIIGERERLGRLLAREEGKPLADAIAEATRAGKTFQYFASQVAFEEGITLHSGRERVRIHTRSRPVGVVGIISPWNFPLAVPSWKIAPALGAGNAVLFKPAESVPGSAWELSRILHHSGVPAGVFSLVAGSGATVGELFATHPDVDAVSFTGSTLVGRRLLAAAHSVGGKRIQAEMGGLNPLIVADDADLEIALDAIVDSSFGSTGQRCTASQRIIVMSGIHDQLVDALTHRLRDVRVGHALDPTTQMGPVANEAQFGTNLQAIQLAQREGAELLIGGEALERPSQGYFMSPALLVAGRPEMSINREEVFGPVACVSRVDEFDEALYAANNVPFGLTSGLITSSLARSERFQQQAEAGLITVNASPAVSELHAPFGGAKASSYGPREQGPRGLEFYSTSSTHFVAG